MNLLLDSHALIWCACDPDRLSSRARAALVSPDNNVYFSAVSLWEIALKYALGKLELVGMTPQDLCQAAEQMGFEALPLTPEVASGFHGLPRIGHKDPFDRMLAWQAIRGKYILVSRDAGLQGYRKFNLRVLW